jgi:hypothetical protein
VPRLFIIDGSKALAKAIRRSFGRHTPIQRCQIQYADFRIMPRAGVGSGIWAIMDMVTARRLQSAEPYY